MTKKQAKRSAFDAGYRKAFIIEIAPDEYDWIATPEVNQCETDDDGNVIAIGGKPAEWWDFDEARRGKL